MQIQNLCKSYENQPILDHLSLDLKEGGIYALMGPSGRGKTTFLHILMGIVPADEGKLLGFSKKRISAVFQEDRLFPFLTAAENIAAVSRNRCFFSASELSSYNEILAELLPASSLSLRVRSFSGGMKRRASLARALLVPSDLLILDEPFTGLDEASRLQTMSFLLKYRNERTLLFSTHRKDDADFLHASLIQL